MTDQPADTPNTTYVRGELAEGTVTHLAIGGHHLGPFAAAGVYRIEFPVTLPAATTEARRPCDTGAPLGPWLRIGLDGIQLVTPPGEVDGRGNTVHPISRERAREMVHALEWMASIHVEVVTDGG